MRVRFPCFCKIKFGIFYEIIYHQYIKTFYLTKTSFWWKNRAWIDIFIDIIRGETDEAEIRMQTLKFGQKFFYFSFLLSFLKSLGFFLQKNMWGRGTNPVPPMSSSAYLLKLHSVGSQDPDRPGYLRFRELSHITK